jgi:hypothetical protein
MENFLLVEGRFLKKSWVPGKPSFGGFRRLGRCTLQSFAVGTSFSTKLYFIIINDFEHL